jgi:hypothetical protein
MIDDCGDADENEESVGFVQEWINTYVFLSRESFDIFFGISFSHFWCFSCFVSVREAEWGLFEGFCCV